VFWVVKLRSRMGRGTFGSVDPEERGNTSHSVSNKTELS
jgi:hypothetical protein